MTYQVMTSPGRRNSGPPYSQAQLPGGSWRREKKLMAFLTDAMGDRASGSIGCSYERSAGESEIAGNKQTNSWDLKEVFVCCGLRPRFFLFVRC